MKRYILLFCLAFIGTVVKLQAQEDRNHGIIWSALHGLEYEVRAGINVGGATPLPLPEEIRALTGYSPNVNLALEGQITKWLGKQKKWGMILGLENKGMEANARVKNYGMEIIGDGGERLSGNWTGKVKTKFRASYFSIPVLAAYQLSKRVKLSAGPYISFKTSGDFNGYVSEGYLRKGDPTGTKVEFKDENTAPYDFSEDLRTFQWGVQVGVNWKAFKRLMQHILYLLHIGAVREIVRNNLIHVHIQNRKNIAFAP
mgnify:CR=1 FL=1